VHLVRIDMYLYCHGISCRCIFLVIAVRILLCTVATANVLAVFTQNLLLLLQGYGPRPLILLKFLTANHHCLN